MTDTGPERMPVEEREADLETAALVRELVAALIKEMRARQTYVAGNPLIERFHRDVQERFRRTWEHLEHLSLTVDEGRFVWRDVPVYTHPVGHDNLAFLFFRDGIRQLAFLPGVESGEIDDFLSILAGIRAGRPVDLLATLWHRDFQSIRMEYVDVAEEESLDVPAEMGDGAGEESLHDLSEIREVLEAGPVPVEEEAEFSDLLMSEADEAYLRREMDLEFNRPLERDVTLALLDQFEMRDQERRRQVVDILREFVPRLLAARDYSTVALIVTEVQLLANKTGEADTQALVAALLRDMSEGMAQLVAEVEPADSSPAGEDLSALLGALQAEAIPILVRAIPSVPETALRDQLCEALERLVSGNPEAILGLLSADDPMLAAEAARIVSRMGIEQAGDRLRVLALRPEAVARVAAIEALAELPEEAGSGTEAALVAALEDEDREVRAAAADAIIRRRPPSAGPVLLGHLRRGRLASLDENEQIRFLKACVAVCGDEFVDEMSALLNGRRWWGGRRPVGQRAGAARALGLVGTERARAALESSRDDRAPAVRSAVRAALRESGGQP